MVADPEHERPSSIFADMLLVSIHIFIYAVPTSIPSVTPHSANKKCHFELVPSEDNSQPFNGYPSLSRPAIHSTGFELHSSGLTPGEAIGQVREACRASYLTQDSHCVE